MTESLFNSFPKVCREFPHLHGLLGYLPWCVLMVASIQWRTVEDVSPILFGVLAETEWALSSIKPDVSWTGVPLIMTKFYTIHLSVLWQPSQSPFARVLIDGVEDLAGPGLFLYQEWAYIIVMHLWCELIPRVACHFATLYEKRCRFNAPVGAVGMFHERSACLGSDDIGLHGSFNVKSFISRQWTIDSICVSFDPMKAECNPLAPSYNELLNRRNEVPITSGVMKHTVGFWSSRYGHCWFVIAYKSNWPYVQGAWAKYCT
jgi:hypothetical protein